MEEEEQRRRKQEAYAELALTLEDQIDIQPVVDMPDDQG